MRSSFFNSKNKDRRYNAEHWAEYFAQFISNGVYANPSTSMQVIVYSGRTVKISAGSCFINGYTGYAAGDDYLTLDYGDGTPRIDRVVVRLDILNREIQPYIIKGVASENPTAPSIIRNNAYYDLCLAHITVAANATEIIQSNIADKRGNTGLCGWVAGLITQINTTNLFAQYEAAWNEHMKQRDEDWNNFFKQLGESDKVILDTADEQARADIADINARVPFKILTGTVSVSLSTPYATVNFSEAFKTVPNVFCTLKDASTGNTSSSYAFPCHISAVSATQFTVQARRIDNNGTNAVAGTVQWVAIGTS